MSGNATPEALYWEHKYAGSGWTSAYDLWMGDLSPWPGTVLDLGCGGGGNTRWLLSQGREVVACDLSQNAVDAVVRDLGVEAWRLDMREKLPFADGRFGLVAADLSLHYFSQEETFRILGEIARVLAPGGALLFRVNSTADVNYGAGDGEETERHLYRGKDGRYKRFFDQEDLFSFFRDWSFSWLREDTSDRYGARKYLWCGCAQPYKEKDA